jgi:membrane protein
VLLAWLALRIAVLSAIRPMRVLKLYSLQHGALLSAGIGFNMFFSITGLLTTGFSVAGLVLSGNKALLDAIIANVSVSAPGLLKVDGGRGLVDPQTLLNPTGLGWAAVVGAVVTIFTSLNWIQSLRDGLRGVMALGPVPGNLLLNKLKDAGTLLLLGVALVLTSAVTLVFGTALDAVAAALGLDQTLAGILVYLVGFVTAVVLAWLTTAIIFRLGAGLKLRRRIFLISTLLAGISSAVLQLLSGLLLGKAGANPLLAPFAVVIGLLIWFNFVSQVYLLAGAWAAIAQADATAGDDRQGKPGRARTIRGH